MSDKDDIEAEFEAWCVRNSDMSFERQVKVFIQTSEFQAYLAEDNRPGRALNIWQRDDGEFMKENWGFRWEDCPLYPVRYTLQCDNDFYVYDGQVYRAGDPTLCTRCHHTLSCALDGGPSTYARFEDAEVPV